MCLRQVSMPCHFCLFLSCVFGVFNSSVAIPAHGLLGLNPILRVRFISENASLLVLYICATTHGPLHQVVNSGSFLSLGLITVNICSFHVWAFTLSFFTMILYNSENSICDISLCRPLLCHSSVVKYTSSLLQQ